MPGAGRVLRVPNPWRANRADWAQLIRFCFVGTSGYVVNLAVFSVLLEGFGVHYLPAAAVAFCIAWTNNFVLNKYWTFRRHELSALRQASRYLLVSVLALGLNLLALHLIVEAGLRELPAQASAIILVTPVSFLLTRRWAFR